MGGGSTTGGPSGIIPDRHPEQEEERSRLETLIETLDQENQDLRSELTALKENSVFLPAPWEELIRDNKYGTEKLMEALNIIYAASTDRTRSELQELEKKGEEDTERHAEVRERRTSLMRAREFLREMRDRFYEVHRIKEE